MTRTTSGAMAGRVVIAALTIALATCACSQLASAEEASTSSSRRLLIAAEGLTGAHMRERAAVDAIPIDEVGVDEFEKDWTDPSWQAGATGDAAHITQVGCAGSIVEWRHDGARPIWNDAPGNVTTAAGGCLGGFADGYASKSRFRHPADVAVSPEGTVLYVADASNRRVRAVSLSDDGAMGVRTIAGVTTAHAPAGGYRDGPGAVTLFRTPSGLEVVRDTTRAKGNTLYVADSTDNRVRVVRLSGNGMASLEVSTLVGGGGVTELEQEPRLPHSGQVTQPPTTVEGVTDVTVGVTGVTDEVLANEGDKRQEDKRRKRKRHLGGESAVDHGPTGIGSTDTGPRRHVSHAGYTHPGLGGHVDGPANRALLRRPRGLAADPEGRTLYVADSGNNAVRAVNLVPVTASSASSFVAASKGGVQGGAVGHVVTLTGAAPPEPPGHKDGTYKDARFHNPSGVVVSTDGRYLYVADSGNHRVRRVDLRYPKLMPDKKDTVVTVAGTGRPGSQDGAALEAQLHDPWGLAIHPDGDLLFISEAGNGIIRTLTLDPTGSPHSNAPHVVGTLTGRGCQRGSGLGGGDIRHVWGAMDPAVASLRDGAAARGGGGGGVYGQTVRGGGAGQGSTAMKGMSASGGRNDGAPVDGPASAACLSMPMGCALSPRGGALYVADSGAERIRRVAAMTPTEIRAAALVYAPPPPSPGTPCYCLSIAHIHVGSDGGGAVVDNTRPSHYFYKSSVFTVVVELDRYTPDFPLNALKVNAGGKVLSAARVGGRDRNKPRYSYVVEAEGRSPVRLRVGTMRRVSAEGKIESGWEGDPEQGIEVLPHPSLGSTTLGVARDYAMDPAIVGMATSFLLFAGVAAAAASGLVEAARRFAAYKARHKHAVMVRDVFGAVEDWRTGRFTVQMVNHKGM